MDQGSGQVSRTFSSFLYFSLLLFSSLVHAGKKQTEAVTVYEQNMKDFLERWQRIEKIVFHDKFYQTKKGGVVQFSTLYRGPASWPGNFYDQKDHEELMIKTYTNHRYTGKYFGHNEDGTVDGDYLQLGPKDLASEGTNPI